MKKKNNHFVPQFHLKQWSHNKKSIMTYNIAKDIYIKDASIKNQASKNYLYGHNENFELAMCKAEEYASPLYSKIINNKSILCLTDEELDFIYFYIQLCNERSFSRAEEFSFIETEKAKVRLRMAKAHNLPGTENITNEDIEKYQASFDNPNLLAVQNIIKYYPLTNDLSCVLLHNKTNYEFLTSDYPTIAYNLFSNVHNIISGWGLSSGGIIYILPINPSFAIMLYDSCAYNCKFNNSVVDIYKKSDINEINKLVILNSHSCIYGSSNIPQNYLRNLKKHLHIEKNNPIDLFGDGTNNVFVLINRKRLNYTASFSFLKIYEEFNKLPIPLNLSGITRPQSKEIEQQIKEYWENKKI